LRAQGGRFDAEIDLEGEGGGIGRFDRATNTSVAERVNGAVRMAEKGLGLDFYSARVWGYVRRICYLTDPSPHTKHHTE
jgi:hypothetical protein